MPSKEKWVRQQIVKKNAVVVRFSDLNPKIQHEIESGVYPWSTLPSSLKQWRQTRMALGASLIATSALASIHPIALIGSGINIVGSVVAGREVQKKHIEIAEEMKRVGILKTGNPENNYPRD